MCDDHEQAYGLRSIYRDPLSGLSEDDRFAEEYEASLMDQLDNAALRKVFSGLIDHR